MLKNLRENVFCKIGCSKIHGVGVIAIKPIPKGVNPFKRVIPDDKIIAVPDRDVQRLDPRVRRLVEAFFQKEADDKWYLPASGLNGIDISFYMNHSNNPNMVIVDRVGQKFVEFKTKRSIAQGEELMINYAR